MDNCYALYSSWNIDCQNDEKILGVFLDKEDAKKALKNQVESTDKIDCEQYGFHIFEDTDWSFDCGIEGEYITNHITTRIISVPFYG